MDPIQPDGWPRPKGYANGIRVPRDHELVFVSGMVGWDADERIVSQDLVAQVEQALRNVIAVVASAGGSPEHVVRMTFYVTDLGAYRASRRAIGDAWRRVMGRHFPAMSLIGVAGLLEEGALVEVEATAAIPPRP